MFVAAAGAIIMRNRLLLVALATLASCAPVAPEAIDHSEPATLTAALDRASARYHVPRDVLAAVSYVETRWTQTAAASVTDEEGQHAPLEVGPLHLRHGSGVDTLSRAEALLNVDEATLRGSIGASVSGAAAVLAELGSQTGAREDDVDSWAEAVARYSSLRDRVMQVDYAAQVWDSIRHGRREATFTGETLQLRGHDGPTINTLLNVDQIVQATADYGPARWVAASSSNYTAGRGGNPINYVVIHTMEGSYSGSISWFQNPSAGASAHYMVRSSDGQITQMVDDQDTAWHAGNWYYNQHSIGIEHEGYVADPARWYTEAMYVASAQLTRHLVDRYGIPIDRSHIIGHYQIPVSGSGAPCSTTATNCGGAGNHTDPGNGGTAWNWTHYMDLVRSGGVVTPMYDATRGMVSYPMDMMSGERAVAYVEYRNDGSATWDITNTRLGTTDPRDHDGLLYDTVNWLSQNRPTAVDHSTAPGATGRFSFMIQAPTVTADTTVTESYALVQEGVAWFPATTAVTFTVHVHAPAPTTSDAGASGDAGASEDASANGDSGSNNGADANATGDASASEGDGSSSGGDGAAHGDGAARGDGSTSGRAIGGCSARPTRSRANGLAFGFAAAAMIAGIAARRRRREN
jgi:N-acetyl-anhydromuramyl-L-alanine amidase AmpD